MLSGMLFQLNWNTVPTYLEQGSILVEQKREVLKRCFKSYPTSRK
ncbi:thioesterase [Hoylesella loescheii]|nr:thioesterase [Hoylesella loescheii]